MSHATRRWAAAMLIAATALGTLTGCGRVTTTPMPSPVDTALTEATQVELVESSLQGLVGTLSAKGDGGAFVAEDAAMTAVESGTCIYYSTSYVTSTTPTVEQWTTLAETAAPVVSGLGMDTEGWLTEQTPSGAGLVAESGSGMQFTAKPTASEDADPGAYEGIRIQVSMPVADDQC